MHKRVTIKRVTMNPDGRMSMLTVGCGKLDVV